MIYFIQVIEKKYNSLNEGVVIQEYPFPDVPVLPCGLINLDTFVSRLDLIPDKNTRIASKNRFHFITNQWHPKNFLRVIEKEWKYGNCS